MIGAIDELYKGLQQLVSDASGVPLNRTILANQGRPAPQPASNLYATYHPVPIRAVGQPRTSLELADATEDFNESLLGQDWQDLEATTISQLDLMVSCNFMNEGARDAAWRMHNANHRFPISEVLWANNIGWRYASEVRDLTGVTQASIQPRYQVDINVYVETQITDSILRANGFSVSIEDEQGNTLANWSSE